MTAMAAEYEETPALYENTNVTEVEETEVAEETPSMDVDDSYDVTSDGGCSYDVAAEIEAIEDVVASEVQVTPFATVEASGTLGGGVSWILYSDGRVVVEPGIGTLSNITMAPWPLAHRPTITSIEFTGPIIANSRLDRLFDGLSNLTSIEGLHHIDTTNVMTMQNMFVNTVNLSYLGAPGLIGWNTSNVTDMNGMFWGTGLTGLDLSAWDVSSVTGMSGMFTDARNLSTIEGIADWDVSNVTTMEAMFMNTESLTSLDLSAWDINNTMFMGNLFNGSGVTYLNLSNWDVSDVISTFWRFFYGIPDLITLNLSNWDVSSVTDIGGMFQYSSLVELDVTGWDVRNVTDMWRMFQDASNLTTIRGISDWDTDSLVDVGNMFNGAHSLTELDLSGWDMSNVLWMHNMFNGASSLTTIGDVSGWDTGSTVQMQFMFLNTGSLTELDLSAWDTSNVQVMVGMFAGAESLTTVGDISNWDTSSLQWMQDMFVSAHSLTELDLSGWDTSNVQDMEYVFAGMLGLTTLDLSGWDTSSVMNMDHMFLSSPMLSELTLSADFSFIGDTGLADVPTTPPHTGNWINIGGTYELTTAQLIAHHNANPANETWVWGRLTQTLTVGAQVGTLTAGTAGTVTFPVTITNTADGDYTVSVENLPTGVTVYGQVTIEDGEGILTLAIDTTALAGTTNTLALTLNDATSAPFTLTITAPAGGGGGGGGGGVTPPAITPPAITPPLALPPDAGFVCPFIDVNNTDWFFNYVMFVCDRGLMVGTSPSTFSPNASLTRAMIVTLLWREAGSPNVSAPNPFSDVTSGTWYSDAVAWAAVNGIVFGLGDGTFAPHANITRQDLAVIIARYANLRGLQISAVQTQANFADSNLIAGYATEAVAELSAAGVIGGRPGNVFDPLGTATRAEVAAMIYRFLNATAM